VKGMNKLLKLMTSDKRLRLPKCPRRQINKHAESSIAYLAFPQLLQSMGLFGLTWIG